MAGGKHLQFLVQSNLLLPTPSAILDAVYAGRDQSLPFTPQPTTSGPGAQGLKTLQPAPDRGTPSPEGETMLLSQASSKSMAKALDLPQLEVELERAIWQVETAIEKSNADVASQGNGTPGGSREEPKSGEAKSQDKTQ